MMRVGCKITKDSDPGSLLGKSWELAIPSHSNLDTRLFVFNFARKP